MGNANNAKYTSSVIVDRVIRYMGTLQSVIISLRDAGSPLAVMLALHGMIQT